MKSIIAIGSDHAGFLMKESLKKWLTKEAWVAKDFGTFSEESVDYPDIAHTLSLAIENKEYAIGVLLCGSGIGMSISANKHQGVRAALCWTVEVATLARQHNDANVLCLPARFIDVDTAINLLACFLKTCFDEGRHRVRVNKI